MIILVDTGGVSEADPEPDAAQTLASATALPDSPLAQTDRGSDAKTVAAAPAAACEGVVLEVALAGNRIPLSCDEDSMWAYVATSYVLGGFAAVLQARIAIQDALDQLERTSQERNAEERAARDRVAHAEDLRQSSPGPGRQRDLEEWQDVLRQNQGNARAAAQAFRRVNACAGRIDALFRQVWGLIAMAEEELLRDYEVLAGAEMQGIAERNKALALAEWTRYGCYFSDDAAKAVIGLDAGKDRPGDVRLALTEQQIKAMWNAALDLRMRAQDIVAGRENLEAAARGAARTQAELDEQRRLRELSLGDRIKAWDESRRKVGRDDPVLLQVYPEITGQTSLPQFRRMVVDALIAVYEESAAILLERAWLTAAGQLRVEPKVEDGKAAPRRSYGAAQDILSDTGYWEALEQYGLTVPASVVIGAKLHDTDTAKNTVWLHLPVRLAVSEKVKTDARRAGFNNPASFEGAAIGHLWDVLESVRERHQAAKFRRSLVIFAAGVVLAPFTSGSSLAAAGVVAAAYSAGEIYDAAKTYAAEGAMARSTLSAVEVALWTRPSTVALVRTVAARSLDVVGALIPAERVPMLVSLAMSAATMAVDNEPG